MESQSDGSVVVRIPAPLRINSSVSGLPSVETHQGTLSEVKAPEGEDWGQSRRGASFAGAAFNFTKGMLGAGILSLPRAVSTTGTVLSAALGAVLMVICTSAMHSLVRAKREANRKATGDQYTGPVITFVDTARAAFGPRGQALVQGAILLQQLCITSGWVIVITNTTQTLLPDFPRWTIVLWFAPILVMLSWIRYVKHLVPFSFLGCAVYVFGIVCVTYWYSFPKLDRAHAAETTMAVWLKAPLFMSTYTYAIGGIIGVLPNESSLKSPRQAPAVINFSMVFYGINALVFGIIAYIAGFGDADTIILALPQGTWVIIVVKIALVFALVMTHPMGINYLMDSIEKYIFPDSAIVPKTVNERAPLLSTQQSPPPLSESPSKSKSKSFWQRFGRYIIRSGLALVTCIIGYAVPSFSLFSNFVGSLVLSCVHFVIPPLMMLKLSPKRTVPQIAITTVLVVYGCSFMVVGTYTAVLNVLKHMHPK